MNAMEMMMKQLGIDPAAIKNSADQIGKLTASIAESLIRIEAQNTRIEAQNTRLEAKLDQLLSDPRPEALMLEAPARLNKDENDAVL